MIQSLKALSVAVACSLCATLVFAVKPIELDTKDVRAGGTPVGDLIRVPIERQQIAEGVYYVSGLSNVYAVVTDDGAIVIDTGFAHQAARQMELLKEVIDVPVKYIFLPQGQHDDIGGIKYIAGPSTEIMMTRATAEYMVFRKRAQSFLSPRYAALYSWADELRTKGDGASRKNPFPYKPITPDILIDDYAGYQFTLGGKRFEVLSLPGAEGINSAGLWMPEEKILFAGGGSVGPEIPMWPNIGTVRADRNRLLDRYIESMEAMLALEPEVLLPGQDEPVFGKKNIAGKLTLLRDSASYVYDEIWRGLGEGKDVYQLMREIKLPERFSGLSQQHGRVEWTVRETVNQTGGWFAYRYTSELYPYRAHEVFADLVDLAGEAAVEERARKQLSEGQLEKAMLMAEALLEADPKNNNALQLERDVLSALLNRAQNTLQTFSEIAWLQSRLQKNKRLLDDEK